MAEPEADVEEGKLAPKSEVEEVGPCKIKVRVEIAADKVDERIEGKYKDLNNSVSLPGFRKGHAPRNLMERKFGKAVLEDVRGDLLAASFDEVREERKLEPLGEPDLDVEKLEVVAGKPFTYEMTLEVRPEIELKDYSGLEVERPAVEVGDAEIDEVLQSYRESKAELIGADDGVKLGDQIIADVVFRVGDKEVDRADNNTIQVSEQLSYQGMDLSGLHKDLLGKKAGDTFEHRVRPPEDFPIKEAAGKDAVLAGTLKSVKRKKLPPLDDAFAEQFDMDDLEELREDVGKRIKREKEAHGRSHMADHLIAEIVKANDFPLPEGLVESSTEEMKRRLQLQLAMQGVTGEEAQKEIEKQSTESKEGFIESLKAHFVMEEIARKERIFVTEDQIEERVAQLAAQQGRWPHEMRAYLEENDLLSQMRRQMREEAVREALLSKAKIVDAPAGKGAKKKKKDEKESDVSST